MESDEQLELFVCGRLCLFGEHSDWAGAFRRFAHKHRPCWHPLLVVAGGRLPPPSPCHVHSRPRNSDRHHPSENAAITPGRTIVVGTQQGLSARVARLATPELRLTVTTDHGGSTASTVMDLRDHESLVNIAQQGGFWSYVAGTAYRIVTDFQLDGCGLVIDNHTTSLPLKKGLSSSAAICVLVRFLYTYLLYIRL